MTLKTSLLLIVVAFVLGVFVSLAIRPAGDRTTPEDLSAASEPGMTATDEGQPTIPEESDVRWRVPVSIATTVRVLGDSILYVRDTVDSLSNGTFVLAIAEPNELTPALQITDAVRNEKIEAGYTWLGYDRGKIPASQLFGAVPFGMEPWEFTAWWYEAGGEQLAAEIYTNLGLHVELCGLISPETAGWFNSRINSLDDLKGLKIRFAGLAGAVLEELGASVSIMSGPDAFQALDKGAIDASEYSLPNVDDELGFDDIAKLNYFPGWHQPFTAIHFVVHLNNWNAISDRQRTIIRTACTAAVTRNLARAEAVQGAVIAKYPEKGIEAIRLPLDVLRELNRVTDAVLSREAENDEDFKRVLDSQKAFEAEYAQWKALAYLPRDF